MNYSKITSDDFKKIMIKIDDSYDYSYIDYKNMHTKIKIICNKHGEFQQTPINMINGFLCKKCKKNKLNELKLNNVLNKGDIIHNHKYNYSLVKYDNMLSYVDIICDIHGIFKQTLNNHINHKKGCPKCAKNFKLTTDDFINKSNIIHDNFFDYSKCNFINVSTKVCIICPIHGDFTQTPNNHLNGIGCPSCRSSKGENYINKLLIKLGVSYIRQKTFKNCKNKRYLPFDFYLPDYNICIEYDGIQHFKIIEKWGGYNNFLSINKNDNIKNEFCKNENIKLIRISYKDNIDRIIIKLIKESIIKE